MFDSRKLKSLSSTAPKEAFSYVQDNFSEAQNEKSNEIKSIATRLAITEMKLNKWSGTEKDFELVYKTVWLEKLMFVQLTYDVNQILSVSRDILAGQKKQILYLGIIISNTGEILASAKEIRLRFDDDKDVTISGGGDCTDCFNSRSDGKIYNGMYIDITPIGGQTDNSIRCNWNIQKSRVAYVLMKFENAKVGDSQTVKFTFYDNSANEMSVYTSCSATITKITTR